MCRRAAELLGVGTNHIRYLLQAERIRGFKAGTSWMISALSLLQYVNSFETDDYARTGIVQFDELLRLLK